MTHASLLDVGRRPGEKLAAALLTTFDPPDLTLLADRVLPALLGLPPAPMQEATEFARSRVELAAALLPLRGKIVVVSSSRGNIKPSWLTSFIRFRRVGANKSVVQHAKVWLLLWQGKNKSLDRLEIIVSSANLTSDGFDKQIQGAWRESILLSHEKQETNRQSWSDLPCFLEELGKACGAEAELSQFAELLYRAPCPKRVSFVATLPIKGYGTESLKRSLEQLKPNRMRVLSPFTGAWTPAGLEKWLVSAGCSGCSERSSISIAAVPTDATVPERHKWILPKKTRDVLWGKIMFGLLSDEVSKKLRNGVDTQHDPRWTHAKLYEFQNAQQKALLVTSANFTDTAWATDGTGNFELGVLLAKQQLPFTMPLAKNIQQVQARGEAKMDGHGFWADAVWDGRAVTIRTRSNDAPSIQLIPEIDAPAEPRMMHKDGLHTVTISRREPVPKLAVVVLPTGKEIVIPVLDVRVADDDLPCGDLDEATAQDWKDRLLLERYGLLVDEDPPIGPSKTNNNVGAPRGSGYGTLALELSREFFGYVDSWQKQMNKSEKCKDSENIIRLQSDGIRLHALFKRRKERDGVEGRVASAVVDELESRLSLTGARNEL